MTVALGDFTSTSTKSLGKRALFLSFCCDGEPSIAAELMAIYSYLNYFKG